MPSEVMVWIRETREQAGGPGQTFKTTADANAWIARAKKLENRTVEQIGKRTFDTVNVTVP